MDKKTTIIIGIIVLVIIVLVVLYFTLFQKQEPIVPEVSEAETSCTESGGVVAMASCCLSSTDFPSTCVIGACGCSAENSKETKVCLCPEGSCFDGTTCVAFEEVIPVNDLPVEENATETEVE